MKQITRLLMMTLFVLALVACEGSPDSAEQTGADAEADTSEGEETGGEEGTIKIGALWPSAAISPVQSKMEAAKEIAEELGVELVNMDAEFDAQTQSEQAKNLLAQQVDGVFLDIIDPLAIVPATKELYEAGIPVAVTTLPIAEEGEEYIATFVGSDNHIGGMMSAEMMIEALGDEGGDVAIIEGAPNVLVTERTAGFNEVIELNDNVEVVEVQSSPWDRQIAMDLMQDFLTKHPDLAGVFVHHDSMVPGVQQAIEQVGRSGEIVIIGFGATIDGAPLIADGTIYGSVSEDLWWQVQEGFRNLVDAINGADVPAETLGEQMEVTIDEIDNYTPKNY